MNKRLFISHASEDKQPFVRDLAEALRSENVDVWYDEYEIKLGMSIRESVDLGLSSCDAGLIVLSPNYFKKKWTIWELNGFIQRMLSGSAKLIPICYNITHEELLRISPSLSDILSLSSEDGVKAIAKKIHDMLYPNKPVLIETRELLNSFGLLSPDYYDNWWLDRIEFLGNINIHYIPWSLPINPPYASIQPKSYSLAWACMRYTWISIAETKGLNQFTNPLYILDFISKTPGVEKAYKVNLNYLALYAPQLLFFDSPIKDEFEKMYRKSAEEIAGTSFPTNFKCELTNDGKAPSCNRTFALLDNDFGRYNSCELLRHFVEGERFGPRPSSLDYWDVLIQLSSEKGEIYPAPVRKALIEGYRSRYAALQLKKVFIKKEPNLLKTIFSTIELLQQAVEEIISDRKLDISTSSTAIAEKICDLHLANENFIDKSFRLTIPPEELNYNYRRITFIQYGEH